MVATALSMAPEQLLAHAGFAHSVRTAAKPASLPPTVSETYAVAALSVPSCRALTSAVVAPEQARKSSAYPLLPASSEG